MNLFDWSELPIEILEHILRQLDPVQCFRLLVTCKSWWSATRFENVTCYLIKFLLLCLRCTMMKRMPTLSLVSPTRGIIRSKCQSFVGNGFMDLACYGWLITIDLQTLDLHLLNPFSRRQIKLPSPKTFPRAYIKEVYVKNVDYFEKVILSEDPSVTDDYIIMAIFSGMTMLAFCRPRKEGKWIVLDCHIHSFQNLIYYREQFYAVNMVGALFAVEIDPQPKLTEITSCLKCHSCTCSRYVVEWSGELLHVRRPMAYDDEPYADSSDSDTADCNWNGSPTSYKKAVIFPDVDDADIDVPRECEDSNIGATHDEDLERTIYRTGIFKVYKLVRMNNCEYKWKKVKIIGDCILFVGNNSAISLAAADFPGTDDRWVYDMTLRKGAMTWASSIWTTTHLNHFYPNVYHSPKFPPIWITPNP